MKYLTFLLIGLMGLILTSCGSDDEPSLSQEGPFVADINAHNLNIQNTLVEDILGDYSNTTTKLELLANFGKSFGLFVESNKGSDLPFIQNIVFTNNDVRTFPPTSIVFDVNPNIHIEGTTIEIRIGVLKYDETILNKIRGCKGFYIKGAVENVEIKINQVDYKYVETIDITYSPSDFDLIPMKASDN